MLVLKVPMLSGRNVLKGRKQITSTVLRHVLDNSPLGEQLKRDEAAVLCACRSSWTKFRVNSFSRTVIPFYIYDSIAYLANVKFLDCPLPIIPSQ